MSIRIEKKIVDYGVAEDERPTQAAPEAKRELADVIHMHEKVERPETLRGSTYKVKTPLSEHALYLTINDIILNPGTEHELRRPFEIFINSKNMDHFQWIVALTRIISAVFRKGGDVTFLVEELKAVFDPRGGYFKKGGKYMPSLVGDKRAEFEAAQAQRQPDDDEESEFPGGAQLCGKCQTKAMIQMDGCLTCLNCGDSKCG